jgi:hypothetical protein
MSAVQAISERKGGLNSKKIVLATCAGGVPKQTENAGGLRFRTEDGERVRSRYKSNISLRIRRRGVGWEARIRTLIA